MKKQIDLVPNGGVSYEEAKAAAQQIANEKKDDVNLWFNVRKGESPEKITPKK